MTWKKFHVLRLSHGKMCHNDMGKAIVALNILRYRIERCDITLNIVTSNWICVWMGLTVGYY